MDYNDTKHQANWVSWSYTSGDTGSGGRQDTFRADTSLPSGFLQIGSATFDTGYDRGHMCPSGDRTISVADNDATFLMSNMIPQTSANNQGLWAKFEAYCRALASGGNEILITCGPGDFGTATISNGMKLPGSVWKVIVVVPPGAGTAASRITTNCRVIAINTPNASTGLGTWESYITSVEEIEAATGFRFFSAITPSVATYLKNVVDTGTGSNSPTVVTSFSPISGSAGATVTISGYNFGSSPVVKFNGVTAVSSVQEGGTQINATVPSGATTGGITVTGTGGTDITTDLFTISGATYIGWLNGGSASDAVFLDYVFGATAPGTLDPSLKPTVAVTSGNLVLTYYTREGTAGLTVTPKTSADLAAGVDGWSTTGVEDVAEVAPTTVNGVSVRKHRASVPVIGVRKFLRIEAVQQ